MGRVCERPSLSKPLYLGLVDLVCRGDTRVLDSVGLGKPYYPFILIAYYVLFHRHNLKTAEAVYRRLREAYENSPYSFDRDEECAFKLLEKVIEDFTALSSQPQEEYRGRLSVRLKETAFKVENTKCFTAGWSTAFKAILVSCLNPEKSRELLENALRVIDIQRRVAVDVDIEIVEAYNLIENRIDPAIPVFLEEIAKEVKKRREEALKKRKRWQKTLDILEKIVIRYNVAEGIKKFEKILNLIKGAPLATAPLIWWFASLYIQWAMVAILIFYYLVLHLVYFFLRRYIRSCIEKEDTILKGLYRALWGVEVSD